VNPGFNFVFTACISLVTGTMFLMWLGEQITERGLGNGISMIILASIISGLPSAIGGTLELANTGELSPAIVLILLMLVLAVTAIVVFIERGQRRLPVNFHRKRAKETSCQLRKKATRKEVIPKSVNTFAL